MEVRDDDGKVLKFNANWSCFGCLGLIVISAIVVRLVIWIFQTSF